MKKLYYNVPYSEQDVYNTGNEFEIHRRLLQLKIYSLIETELLKYFSIIDDERLFNATLYKLPLNNVSVFIEQRIVSQLRSSLMEKLFSITDLIS